MMRYFTAPNREVFDKAAKASGVDRCRCVWVRDLWNMKGLRDITITVLPGSMQLPEFKELYYEAQTRDIKMVIE